MFPKCCSSASQRQKPFCRIERSTPNVVLSAVTAATIARRRQSSYIPCRFFCPTVSSASIVCACVLNTPYRWICNLFTSASFPVLPTMPNRPLPRFSCPDLGGICTLSPLLHCFMDCSRHPLRHPIHSTGRFRFLMAVFSFWIFRGKMV